MNNPTTAQQLNQSNLEETAKLYKKATKDIIKALINKVPREDLIEALVDKKIIMKDWEQKGNKYKVRE